MPLDPDFLFAVLLGIFALVAFFLAATAARRPHANRPRSVGWLALGIAAAVQVVNLISGYSWVLSVVTTAGLLGGLWLLSRAREARP